MINQAGSAVRFGRLADERAFRDIQKMVTRQRPKLAPLQPEYTFIRHASRNPLRAGDAKHALYLDLLKAGRSMLQAGKDQIDTWHLTWWTTAKPMEKELRFLDKQVRKGRMMRLGEDAYENPVNGAQIFRGNERGLLYKIPLRVEDLPGSIVLEYSRPIG